MEILLTAPPNVAEYATKNPGRYPGVTAIYSDPEGTKLGSGGGTVNVLVEHFSRSRMQDGALRADPGSGASHRSKMQDARYPASCIPHPASFSSWLASDKRIIIHSDGQSRRLPAYGPVGKSFIPFPVFKWGRGQRIDQTLFDIQRPLLESILERAPAGLNTMVAAGDALVWTDQLREKIPQADVVCIGIWAQPEVAVKHGVFVCPRKNPASLEYMLQKPSLETLQSLTEQFLYLLDAGIWLLSDRAVGILCEKSGVGILDPGSWILHLASCIPDPGSEMQDAGCKISAYDLYSEFGSLLGARGESKLSVAIVPLEGAEFYHFGSNSDLLKSTSALHNRVMDQREIWHKKIKPSPDIFVQNSRTAIRFDNSHSSIWIENSDVPDGWKLHDHHIVTGVPENDWRIELPAGVCLDVVPVGKDKWCVRTYGFNDVFRMQDAGCGMRDAGYGMQDAGCGMQDGGYGMRDEGYGMQDAGCRIGVEWMNEPIEKWFGDRGFTEKEIQGVCMGDMYDFKLFPVLDEKELSGDFIQWIVGEERKEGRDEVRKEVREGFRKKWLRGRRLSAGEIIRQADLGRLLGGRDNWVTGSLERLAENAKQSIFYQLDLKRVAGEFWKRGLKLSLIHI